MKIKNFTINFTIQNQTLVKVQNWFEEHALSLVVFVLTVISGLVFIYYYLNGLGLAYNDARSHLDIGRRVVEGLKPGLAQIGSVWLPLNHILMIPTVWSDFMWHSGLSGALISMISFVLTGVIVYLFLKKLGVGLLGRFFGVLVFAANLNILYLQSTAMTELLLIATMTAGAYYLMLWAKKDTVLDLIKAAFWIMMSTTVRYDGWFLLLFSAGLVALTVFFKKGYKTTEGMLVLFLTLGGFGIALWFLWNLVIFKDPLYFIFGPFAAHTQQEQLSAAGNLATKGNLLLSIKVYLYALIYNSYAYTAIVGFFGAIALWVNKKIKGEIRVASVALTTPLLFNVIALFLGFSVLFIQGIAGNTWFNVRYGIMLAPSIAIFSGYLVDKVKDLRWIIIGLYLFTTFFAFTSGDAVTIDDARVGSSQKNVTEVSGWLKANTSNREGFVLISAASHDAIIFSSGLPMKKFIHEGTGAYWQSATTTPDHWARWIVMRTHDDNDLVWKSVSRSEGFIKYDLVDSYPFADIYVLKQENLLDLNTKPVFSKQK
ncbi:hypothetical protein A2962_03215 [Candidatus Woesebacteria bacterium RIFCSPLOWO2_01_FULL_39_61]|uniref:Uncharacterized protein n=1 Tax=Candidatus Woesebacteria bacterium RIFCSPHIGHO2_02_FULL_39_13 TaxID=1802505 RepID=A0A1F7Z2H0_9BACT|nr:MAG: hypothetical protein A2692_04300 [Candidatus Woesebacteria bacterium RIFCSPHIGHO2_01_FULL_39_95]OGM33833.1 MAG: hypothetical protein A3D01_02585 [Candidatus Woesebacteria bacterium RIFCSPHIGHO2_02_FULL_39_13]OGM38994.1 MAG: hypothetical protein A3E13_04855 [Candidatus Woesebacteria bacterium RIFCSPHIGHO2_12_FULL_40_20]OGM67499.1 MAG: hypothetical protein A2962_03215 [Candidatus Woesebacteria bacterium RIFCSPLOWO2_01_FULL_39_61]